MGGKEAIQEGARRNGEEGEEAKERGEREQKRERERRKGKGKDGRDEKGSQEMGGRKREQEKISVIEYFKRQFSRISGHVFIVEI